MPERVVDTTVSRAPRRRRSLRMLVFAGLLAAVTTLLSAGIASADYWPPRAETASPAASDLHP